MSKTPKAAKAAKARPRLAGRTKPPADTPAATPDNPPAPAEPTPPVAPEPAVLEDSPHHDEAAKIGDGTRWWVQ